VKYDLRLKKQLGIDLFLYELRVEADETVEYRPVLCGVEGEAEATVEYRPFSMWFAS
jgi:hypothetical protein